MNEQYIFKYSNTVWDFWLLMLYNTYGSLIGMCNVMFTFAMVALTIRFWGTTADIVRTLLVLSCLFFPVVQPILLYSKAKKEAQEAPKISLLIHEDGIHVETKDGKAELNWSQMECVRRRPKMLILFLTKTNAFILPDRVIGKEKRGKMEFYRFVSERFRNKAA